MGTPNHGTVATRWVARANGSRERELTGANVFEDDGRLYSYGHHFELGRALRDKKRKTLKAFLLNGDRYSNTTDRHQSITRNAVHKYESVIIPYSALGAAGVDLDSVRVVHRLEDRWESTEHRTTERPEGSEWFIDDVHEHVDLTPEEIARGRTDDDRFIYPGQTKAYRKTGTRQALYTNRHRRNEIKVTWGSDRRAVLYEWTTGQHWLGESLIRARVMWWEDGKTRERWTLFLSGFDHQEPRPLYFLCELPYHCKATTVAEAYEALKPDVVKLAEQMGRSYTRQGDIFAIPAPAQTLRELRKTGARIAGRGNVDKYRNREMPYLLGTNHTATEVAYLPNGVTLARGTLYHDPSGRAPDHIRRRIGDGKTWHIIVKNTVPLGRR